MIRLSISIKLEISVWTMSLRLSSAVREGTSSSNVTLNLQSSSSPSGKGAATATGSLSSLLVAPMTVPGQQLLVTVSEIVAAHRKVLALQQQLSETQRAVQFWQLECEGRHKCIANLEKDLMLERAETTRWKVFWEEYAAALYRHRVLVGNTALLALKAQYGRAASDWKDQEKSLTTCLCSTTSALEGKMVQNAALTKQVKELKDELNTKDTEILRLRAAVEVGAETAHLEGEIAARDDLINHLRQANHDLSSAVAGGGGAQSIRASLAGEGGSSAASSVIGAATPFQPLVPSDSPVPRQAPPPVPQGAGFLVSKMASSLQLPPSPTNRLISSIGNTAEVVSGRKGDRQLTKQLHVPRHPSWRNKPVHLLTEAEMEAFLQHELTAAGGTSGISNSPINASQFSPRGVK